MNAPEKIYYTIGMGGFPQLALEPDGRWTTEYIRTDIHEALQRQIDEACAVTESCPTLQHMVGAVIDGSVYKDQLEKAQDRERALRRDLERALDHFDSDAIREECRENLRAYESQAPLPPDPRDAEIERLKQRVENEQDQREAATLQTLLMTHFQACRPAYPAGLYGWATAALAGSTAPGGEGWMPIETAPRDGTIIIVCGGIARWHNGAWHSVTAIAYPGREIQWEVTHWMPFPEWTMAIPEPLPEPPVTAKQGEGDGLARFKVTYPPEAVAQHSKLLAQPEKEAGEWEYFEGDEVTKLLEGDHFQYDNGEWDEITDLRPGLPSCAGVRYRRWHPADSGKN